MMGPGIDDVRRSGNSGCVPVRDGPLGAETKNPCVYRVLKDIHDSTAFPEGAFFGAASPGVQGAGNGAGTLTSQIIVENTANDGRFLGIGIRWPFCI